MMDFGRKLWDMVKPYRGRLFLGVLVGFLSGVVEPLLMIAAKLVVDVLFPTEGMTSLLRNLPDFTPEFLKTWLDQLTRTFQDVSASPRMILGVVALIPAVMLLRGLLSYLNVYLLQWVATRAITDLRIRLFRHLFSLPLSFFHRMSTGELMSRIMADVAALHNVVSNSLSTMIKDPCTLLSLLALLLWQQPRLTLISMVVLPVCVVPIVVYNRKVRRAAAQIQTQFAQISKVMHESFTGTRVIKAYNLEQTVADQFTRQAREYVSHQMRLVRSLEIPGPLIEFFGALGVALVLVYIAFRARSDTTSAGDLVLLIGSLFAMYRPMKYLARLQQNLVQARAASDRVFLLLNTHSDILEPAHPVPLHASGADLHFDSIDFNYGEKPVLRDVNLTVKAGTVVALVGGSGAGKTTLTNLLLRFYDPQRGTVRIGDVELPQVATRELRNQIAVVTQEVILFNDTIRNNIALGRPGATEAEIVAAAQHAHAHEFILEKPNGYDTVIGEKGVALSGGQRQRLAIARAILRDAPILVLDEATSALDTESERVVQAALEALMRGRTTICIAHRLSTIQKADVIVVLDQGRIVEQGSHAELLQRGGIYRKLYELQFQT